MRNRRRMGPEGVWVTVKPDLQERDDEPVTV